MALAAQRCEESSEGYAFAKRAKVVLAPLKALTGLNLAQENLRTINADRDYAPMARITDTWSPQATAELYSRPAQLTPFSRLQELGVGEVQDFISWLHFTEEFDSESLKFGHVAIDATPSELPCQRGHDVRQRASGRMECIRVVGASHSDSLAVSVKHPPHFEVLGCQVSRWMPHFLGASRGKLMVTATAKRRVLAK